jgi:hypothetical protein
MKVAHQVLQWRHKDVTEDPTWPTMSGLPNDYIWSQVGEKIRLRTEMFNQLGEALGLLGRYSRYWTRR